MTKAMGCVLWVLTAAVCLAGESAPPKAAAPLTPEQQIARDALRRFVGFAKAEYLPVAPDPLLGDALPDVKGCKLEFVTRDDLVARHRGQRKAPMIVAVTVQPPAEAKDGGRELVVLVALEVAALEGFEELPDGVGREYVYRQTGAAVEFAREQGWVE